MSLLWHGGGDDGLCHVSVGVFALSLNKLLALQSQCDAPCLCCDMHSIRDGEEVASKCEWQTVKGETEIIHRSMYYTSRSPI